MYRFLSQNGVLWIFLNRIITFPLILPPPPRRKIFSLVHTMCFQLSSVLCPLPLALPCPWNVSESPAPRTDLSIRQVTVWLIWILKIYLHPYDNVSRRGIGGERKVTFNTCLEHISLRRLLAFIQTISFSFQTRSSISSLRLSCG